MEGRDIITIKKHFYLHIFICNVMISFIVIIIDHILLNQDKF